MLQTGLLTVVAVAAAIFELRGLSSRKLYRDAAIYCALCLAAIAFAFYFDSPSRNSIISAVNALMRNRR